MRNILVKHGIWRTALVLESLWPAGLVTILGLLIIHFLPTANGTLGGEKYEWLLFILLGFAFPFFAAAAALGFNRLRVRHGVYFFLAGFALIALYKLWVHPIEHRYLVLLLGLSTAFMWSTVNRTSNRTSSLISKLVKLAILTILNVACWAVAVTLIHWEPLSRLVLSTYYGYIAFLLAIGLTFAALRNQPSGLSVKKSTQLSYFDVIAVLLFLALSFRTDSLFVEGSFFHWGYYVGPIEAVRQGGWLLWDVPSQYGFLSILLPALLPINDAWEALYVTQGIFLLGIAMLLYTLLRRLSPSLVNAWLAVLLTASVVFFSTSELTSPTTFPSGSVMRFVWCYALLAVFWFDYQWWHKSSKSLLIPVGTIIWLLGVLWSAESAVYSSAIFLPGLVLHGMQAHRRKLHVTGILPYVTTVAKTLAIPAGALLLVLSILTGFYLIKIGHLPDPSSYYEYVISYSAGGLGVLPVTLIGPVWVLLGAYILILSLMFRLFWKNRNSPALPLLTASLFGVWAISSYFVGRSHPWNVTVLLPELCMVLAIGLNVIKSEKLRLMELTFKIIVLPLFVVIMASNALSKSTLLDFMVKPQTGYDSIGSRIPALDKSVNSLLLSAGVNPSDAIVYDGDYDFLPAWQDVAGNRVTSATTWLPKPLTMLMALSKERRDTYNTRYLDQIHSGGWLLRAKGNIKLNLLPEAFINQNFKEVEKFENNEWLLIKYAPSATRQ